MLLDSGPGYFNILLSLLLCQLEGIEVEIVFAQCLFKGNVAVVRFAVAVQVFKAALDVLDNDTGRKVFDGLVQNLAEPFDLLLVPDALGDVPAESPQDGLAFVACHPIGTSFHCQHFGVFGQRVVEDEAVAFFSLAE